MLKYCFSGSSRQDEQNEIQQAYIWSRTYCDNERFGYDDVIVHTSLPSGRKIWPPIVLDILVNNQPK